MKFSVKGKMNLGSEKRKFTKEVEAPNANQAKERVYTVLGAQHRLRRNKVEIEEVSELK